MNPLRDMQQAARDTVAPALTWTLWLFALNLAWEVVQLPLYALGRYSGWADLGYAVLHCTLGDAAMAFAAYLIAALVTQEPRWLLRRPLTGLAVVLVAGESFTIWAEWYNVYVLHSWAYAARMPTIRGIGVAPLAQWLVLPVLALVVLRYLHRHRLAAQVPKPARR